MAKHEYATILHACPSVCHVSPSQHEHSWT